MKKVLALYTGGANGMIKEENGTGTWIQNWSISVQHLGTLR